MFSPDDLLRVITKRNFLYHKHLGWVLDDVDPGMLLCVIVDHFASLSAEDQQCALSRGNLPLTFGYNSSKNSERRNLGLFCIKPGYTNAWFMGNGQVGWVVGRLAMGLQNLLDEVDPMAKGWYPNWRLKEFAIRKSQDLGLDTANGEILREGKSITIAATTNCSRVLLEALLCICKEGLTRDQCQQDLLQLDQGSMPDLPVIREVYYHTDMKNCMEVGTNNLICICFLGRLEGDIMGAPMSLVVLLNSRDSITKWAHKTSRFLGPYNLVLGKMTSIDALYGGLGYGSDDFEPDVTMGAVAELTCGQMPLLVEETVTRVP